jgi:hypothetical protein
LGHNGVAQVEGEIARCGFGHRRVESRMCCSHQVDDAKQRPRKARAPKKGDSVAVEVRQLPASGNVIMPPQKQEGLEADVAGIGVDTLVVADSVYNKELRCGAIISRSLESLL